MDDRSVFRERIFVKAAHSAIERLLTCPFKKPHYIRGLAKTLQQLAEKSSVVWIGWMDIWVMYAVKQDVLI